jgi:CDP-paratose 2-epimerase
MEGARSLYGATKYAAEIMLEDYAQAFDFPLVIDRFGVIAGPWQFGKSDQGIAPFWTAAHLFGKSLTYIGFGGHGKQVRDFLHIADAINLIISQIRKIDKFACDRRIPTKTSPFNAGGGLKNSASLLELTTLCRKITNKTVPIGSEKETRYADIPIYISDNSKINSVCGWMPQKNLETVISDIYEWLIACPSAKKIFSTNIS